MSGPASLMPAVILAGGYATRLRPITEKIPKALVDVAGRPFLWHQLQLLKRQGAHKVVLAVGHLGELIQQEFGDGSDLDMSLEYSFDRKRTRRSTGERIENGVLLLNDAPGWGVAPPV